MRALLVAVFAATLIGMTMAGGGGGGGDPSVSLDGVLDLNPENFDEVVGKDKHVLVEFYAPWCGHCKSLVPEYGKLGAAVKAAGASSNVAVAKVNAEEHSALGSRFGVTGFPTIKYFPAGSTTAEDYKGGRDAKAFVDFLNGKAGSRIFVPREVNTVTVLDHANFDKIALDPTKDVLVEFYAPWCGHCKSLAPTYEKVAQTYQSEPNIVIANVNADEAANKGLAERFGVSGFPTLKWFPKGNKAGEEYNGGRGGDDFVTFINEKTGVSRVLGGALGSSHGTEESLNALAQEFFGADGTTATEVKQKIEERVKELGEKFGYYGKVVEKILSKGKIWVDQEVSRLEKMVEGNKVALNLRDGIYSRLNVLRKFKA